MSTKTIPTSFEISCDSCEKTEPIENAQARPVRWTRLRYERDIEDMQGNAAADGTVKVDLCPDCTTRIVQLINEGMKKGKVE